MEPSRNINGLATALLAGGFAGLVWAEQRRRLRRRRTEPRPRRMGRNLALAAVTGIALRLAERPLIGRLARQVERKRWGLTQRLPLPAPARGLLALLLMDYTLYWWHIMLHRLPVLWRCHLVHHADLELDASTAVRFHFGEFLLGIPYRAAQVLAIGVTPGQLALWQKLTLAEVIFHHANLRLPLALERRLSRWLVTPRLHGIHHSMVPEETDSNYSSGLTLWDRLHGTLRQNVPQRRIRIGVPAYRRPLPLPALLALPFRNQPDSARLPNGHRPRRRLLPPRRRLAA